MLKSINHIVFADQNKPGEWAGSQEETLGGRLIFAERVSVSQGCDGSHFSLNWINTGTKPGVLGGGVSSLLARGGAFSATT